MSEHYGSEPSTEAVLLYSDVQEIFQDYKEQADIVTTITQAGKEPVSVLVGNAVQLDDSPSKIIIARSTDPQTFTNGISIKRSNGRVEVFMQPKMYLY